MQQGCGLNPDDFHENSYQMSTSVLSAEEHSVSGDFLEPEQFSFPTPVERVDQPSTSSRECTTKFTLAISGERGRNDKRKDGGHDGKNLAKHKGRPTLGPVYSTQADKRRTQIRLAQRAFRGRQEAKIQSLENKVLNMENAISQTTKVLLDFEGKILASGVLDQAPEISHSLRVLAKAIASDQDNGNDNVENESREACSPAKALGEVEDSMTSVDHDAIVSQYPPFKHGVERTARDRTAQVLVKEYMQHFHQNQQSPGIALPFSVPQAIHQIGSDDGLNYTAMCRVAQTFSDLRKKGDETDPGYIKNAATEEPDSDTCLVFKPPLEMLYFLAPSAGQQSFSGAFATVTLPGHRSPDCLRVVAEVRHSSPIIYNVFLSVSATYFGSFIGDSKIVFAAQKFYKGEFCITLPDTRPADYITGIGG
ncbi:hypothetical protein B0O99DRAFT_672302 [Bisporella sp. PMI_857]|nr:hypothetical protein B0O99DRAFT_672302 [Bisporella sp. PMI_857]